MESLLGAFVSIIVLAVLVFGGGRVLLRALENWRRWI
jgi:hypothetical protein